MNIQSIARKSFFFYISIFVLMLFFESQRFNIFFDRESSKIPQLDIVSEYIGKISEITGISFVTQALNQATEDLSQEYIVSDSQPMSEQFLGFISQYANYDFSKTDRWKKHDSTDENAVMDITSLTDMDTTKASNEPEDVVLSIADASTHENTHNSKGHTDVAPQEKAKTNTDYAQTSNATNAEDLSADTRNREALGTDTIDNTSALNAPEKNDKEENKDDTQTNILALNSPTTVPLEKNDTVNQTEMLYGKMPENEIIQKALLDKNMTATILAKQKQIYLEELHASQKREYIENASEGEHSAKETTQKSSRFLNFFSSEETELFPEDQKNPYYDQRNSSPAPTEQALNEYKSILPDYGKKNKVLIVGDSMMMEGLGPTLQATLRKRSDLKVIREGRYSSGLSRPDFYNWPKNIQKLANKENPDLIIISMGANDTQDIVINKKRHFIDTQSWERVYGIRTFEYLNLAAADNRKILWVSLPVMGLETYFTRTKRISKIQAEVSSYFDNVTYMNIENLLTEKGKYVNFIKGKDNNTIRLRQKDHIHVTQEGGQILTNYILPQIQESINNIRFNEVNNAPMPPMPGQANHVAFTSTLRNKKTEYFIYLPTTLPKNLTTNLPTSSAQALSEPLPYLQSNLQTSLHVSNIRQQPSSSQMTDTSKNKGTSTDKGKNSFPDDFDNTIVKPMTLNEKTPFIPTLIRENMNSAEERFPVLYILHGAYDSGAYWNKVMGKELQKIADEKRVIIVAPSGEPFGWYVDSPIVAQNQIESFMVKELVPHIDMLYPTNKKRALAGLSMGGHGAMLLGFKYPKTFPSVASASGVLDIRLHPDQWKIKDLLGTFAENKETWDKNSVAADIGKKWKKYAPQQILIVTGTEDILVLEDNRLARDLLEKRQYDFEYEEAPGNHDVDFWAKHIPAQLRKQADFLHSLDAK